MKKLLLITLITIIGYTSFIQSFISYENPLNDLSLGFTTWTWYGLPEDYKMLYYLPGKSKIKNKCGQLYRAFVWRGEGEIQCDDIENEFLKLTRQERDALLQVSDNLEDSSRIKEFRELLYSPTIATSTTPLQKETMVNLINLILPEASNEEKKEELNLFLSSSYKIAAKEAFKRMLLQEKKKFRQYLYQEYKEFGKHLDNDEL